MIDPNDFLDAVEAYEENRLAPTQRRSFEQQCQTDPALQLTLDDYRLFRHSIESVDLKKRLDNIHNRLEYSDLLYSEPTQPFGTTRTRWGRWTWVAAASVLLTMGVWFGWIRPARQEAAQMQAVFMAFYRPEPPLRGSADCSANLTPIIRLYRSKDYVKAVQLTDSQLTDDGLDNICLLYYRGLCELALGQPGDAVYALESAHRPASGSLRQRADWYLALAYLANNDPTNARQQLAQIARQAGHSFGPVAAQTLAKLGK